MERQTLKNFEHRAKQDWDQIYEINSPTETLAILSETTISYAMKLSLWNGCLDEVPKINIAHNRTSKKSIKQKSILYKKMDKISKPRKQTEI